MAARGLYQPKMKDEKIRALYRYAKKQGVPMTRALDGILGDFLETKGFVFDEAPAPRKRTNGGNKRPPVYETSSKANAGSVLRSGDVTIPTVGQVFSGNGAFTGQAR